MIPRYIIGTILIVSTLILTIVVALFIGKKEAKEFLDSVQLKHIFGED